MYLYCFDDASVKGSEAVIEVNGKKYAFCQWMRLDEGYELKGVNGISFFCKNDIEMTVAAKKLKLLFLLKHDLPVDMNDIFNEGSFDFGFQCGRESIIKEMLNGIKIHRRDQVAIYLKQKEVSSKYCFFECPFCEEKKSEFKITQNVGSCESCKTQFQNFEKISSIANDKEYPDEIGVVEFYHC